MIAFLLAAALAHPLHDNCSGSQFAVADIVPGPNGGRTPDRLVVRIDELDSKDAIVGWVYVMDDGAQLTQRALGFDAYTGLTVLRPSDVPAGVVRLKCKGYSARDARPAG